MAAHAHTHRSHDDGHRHGAGHDGPGHGHDGHGHDGSGLADLLDLDAEMLGSFLDELTGWAAEYAPDEVRVVADIGAGTGTGTIALAHRFAAADVLAIDRSETMLDRVRAAAGARGLDGRVRLVPADLDAGWPQVGAVDVAWAALSLHEMADPERLLADVHDALTPGGMLAVVEMDGFPRFLPDDVGFGRPGLEARCHEAVSGAGWNRHPDWRGHLEGAGFEVLDQRTFPVERPATSGTARYASSSLLRMRDFLADTLAADDLAALDRLLGEGPDAITARGDLVVRGSRTGWVARRP